MQRIRSLLDGVVTLAVPLALIGAALRLILLPSYLQVEYAMPYFPPDEYGFTTDERLQWATRAWNYLVNTSDESYLADLTFPDGSPVFNEREVVHMRDVQGVVGGALSAWYAALAVIAAVGLLWWRVGRLHDFRQSIRLGGWMTIGLSALIGTIVAVGMVADPNVFWEFFTIFHGLFFEGDSWLFAYSDTLIRLFPIRFWQDTFLCAALIVLGGGLALALGLREPPSPSARSS